MAYTSNYTGSQIDTAIGQVGNKVDKVTGKGLSTNDYTTADKNKLNGIETGAEVNTIEVIKVNGTIQTIVDKTVDIQAGSGSLIFTNKTVATTDWIADTTYQEFGYKADIICQDVTSNDISEVMFNVPEAISGNYAPISVTGNGIVTIYAVEAPTSAITIPTIICTKG